MKRWAAVPSKRMACPGCGTQTFPFDREGRLYRCYRCNPYGRRWERPEAQAPQEVEEKAG